LNISIVGAGIAGLTAAIVLRRNGYLVQVFEASEIKTEIGAALGVQPNVLRVLDHLGVSRTNLRGVPHTEVCFSLVWGAGLHSVISYQELQEMASIYCMLSQGLLCHRNDLHNELKRLATGEGEGPPAKIHLGSRVLAGDAEEGTITLEGGKVVHADLILGADGVNSVIRTEILGGAVTAPSSGLSCFRTVFEAQTSEIPELEWLTAEVSGTRSAIVKDGPFRMFLMYPCRNGSLINFIAFFTDSPGDEAGWTPTGSREEIMEKFPDFHPKLLRVLDLPSHSPIHKWKLKVLPLLPTWIRGQAALLGDSAHATMPFLAQGAGMAIEEAGTIGCLLPLGTRREDIPGRLEAYQDIRKYR
ncbi:hypothetical protein B0H17DRAFT_874242, partial [Mycena rosella]